MIDFLNLGSDEKSPLAGSEFQTLTIRLVKKLRLLTISVTLAGDGDLFALSNEVDLCFPPALCFSSENMPFRR